MLPLGMTWLGQMLRVLAPSVADLDKVYELDVYFWILLVVSAGAVWTIAGRRVRSDRKFNLEEWPRLQADWEKRWCCLRCGETFTPSPVASNLTPSNG